MKKKKRQKTKQDIQRVNSDIETPRNIEFVEISMPHEELDVIAQKNSQLLDQRNDPKLRKHTVRRQEKLLRKTFKAASQVLTENQFSIFTMRYIYNMPEKEIALQIGRNQSYIPSVLKASIKKIQKQLRIDQQSDSFRQDRKIKES